VAQLVREEHTEDCADDRSSDDRVRSRLWEAQTGA